MAAIPHSDADRISLRWLVGDRDHLLERNAREITSFGQTKCGAYSHEAGIILDESHDDAHESPGSHDEGNPDRRTSCRW
jgi:hypothetical protein